MTDEPQDKLVQEQIALRRQTTEEVFAAMRELGLFPGDPTQRRERAEDLVRSGLTEARLRLLGEHVLQTTDGMHRAAKILAWQLGDLERWEPLVTDLEFYAGRASKAEKEGGVEHYPNMPIGADCCACPQCTKHRSLRAT